MPSGPAAAGRFLLLDREKLHDSFAADVSAEEAAFMADSQVPRGAGENERAWQDSNLRHTAPETVVRGVPARAMPIPKLFPHHPA